jgi:hypothetical protein
MGAFTFHTGIAQDFPQFGPFVFGEAAEAAIGVSHRRAQLDPLKSGVGKLLDRAGKVLGDHLPDGISLTSYGHAKRIGAKLPRACAQ